MRVPQQQGQFRGQMSIWCTPCPVAGLWRAPALPGGAAHVFVPWLGWRSAHALHECPICITNHRFCQRCHSIDVRFFDGRKARSLLNAPWKVAKAGCLAACSTVLWQLLPEATRSGQIRIPGLALFLAIKMVVCRMLCMVLVCAPFACGRRARPQAPCPSPAVRPDHAAPSRTSNAAAWLYTSAQAHA